MILNAFFQTWDDDLAYTAMFNVKQCKMNHDICRSTQDFQYAGQNLAISGDTNDEFLANWVPGFWFEEYPRANMNDIRSQGRLRDENGYVILVFFVFIIYCYCLLCIFCLFIK